MLHLLSSLFFLAALAGAGTSIVLMVQEEMARIPRRQPAAAPRPWSTRVRGSVARAGRVRPVAPRAAA